MTELTFKEFCGLPMMYVYGNNGPTHDRRQLRNYEHDVGKEIYTEFHQKNHKWGKQNVVWFMGNDKRNFSTVDQLYVAYMEKACGVNNVPKD